MSEQLKHILMQAREEILTLRRRNEVLQAQIDVMELFGLTLRTKPNFASVSMGVDIAWELAREIEALHNKEAATKADHE